MKDVLSGIAWFVGILMACAFLGLILSPPGAFLILLVCAAFAFS